MARLTERDVEAIARRIVADLHPAAGAGARAGAEGVRSGPGVFATVDEAARAAGAAQPAFVALPLAQRAAIIASIRATMLESCEALARAAWEETGLGRVEDKVVKNRLVTEKTAGLEELFPLAVTGDHGLTLTEPAPFGVIGAITPCTNPTSTIICNAIGMLAAGNSVVFNAHPAAKACSIQTVVLLNRAITAAGGPANVVACVAEPTIATAQEMMRHPAVRLLVVTGGGAVVKVAMGSGKRAICAGPGNPPVVVDETADIAKAGRDIVLGASTDNNIICTDEKEVLCVEMVADGLIKAMTRNGAVLVDRHRLSALEKVIFTKVNGPRQHAEINRDLIGKNASVILAKIGIDVPDSVRLGLVEVGEDHPLLWTEQMMPIMPFCRVPNADYAIDLAVKVEGGNRHTAVMHSKNLDHLSRMAKECNCSIFVKNGRSQAGLGLDGEGPCSFTIASPTGEGMTGPRSFSRFRRCVLVDHFRIT
ncbi:MAG TPA: aldehyde dehydrogenase family protein [Thermoanaerobaculaceae bacterium]|nr:aldehyde dehydrogenase family protein [Thermoanaerobaculaceae bacterium]